MLISNKSKLSKASSSDCFSVNFVAYAEHLKMWFKNSLDLKHWSRCGPIT